MTQPLPPEAEPASIFSTALSKTRPPTATYNVQPLLDAPAILAKAQADPNNKGVRIIVIPESWMPSPLAPNLSARRLLEVKTALVGVPGGPRPKGNGEEIWLSWKRAYDLWNNFYIPGRVNPVWVRNECERRERERKVWEKQKGDKRRAQLPKMWHESLAGGNSGGGGTSGTGGGSQGNIGLGMTGKGDNRQAAAVSNSKPKSEGTDPEYPGVTDRTCDEDGSSGGFFALKDIPELKWPPPTDDDEFCWDDPIDNTVWRPRRVGEKTLKIDLDESLEEFQRNSDLEFDGGFDCGRTPYPVFRPLIQYVKTQEGAFKKKKTWDGVTGTIFNMPTKPLEPGNQPKDAKLERVNQMYRDSYHNLNRPQHANDGIFPLNIRRLMRVDPVSTTEKRTPLLVKRIGSEETLMYDRSSEKDPQLFPRRDMTPDDPWWVTAEQRMLADQPPRRYPPPAQKYDSELLPIDETLWQEEYQKDDVLKARYFVTNLHGGTLIVNGLEVREAEVAGPLPAFAVIECPGGQVAFWFGTRGRNHGEGDELMDPKLREKQWDVLRKLEGWETTGLTAGEVWNEKIKDREKRKRSGEAEDDDEEWDAWMKAKPVEDMQTRTDSVTYQLTIPGSSPGKPLPLPDNIAQPHVVFPSAEEELAYLTAQSERRPPTDMSWAILPSEEDFLPGSVSRSNYIQTGAPTQQEVDSVWPELIEDRQRAMLRTEEIAKRARAERERIDLILEHAADRDRKKEQKKKEAKQQALVDRYREEKARADQADRKKREAEREAEAKAAATIGKRKRLSKYLVKRLPRGGDPRLLHSDDDSESSEDMQSPLVKKKQRTETERGKTTSAKKPRSLEMESQGLEEMPPPKKRRELREEDTFAEKNEREGNSEQVSPGFAKQQRSAQRYEDLDRKLLKIQDPIEKKRKEATGQLEQRKATPRLQAPRLLDIQPPPLREASAHAESPKSSSTESDPEYQQDMKQAMKQAMMNLLQDSDPKASKAPAITKEQVESEQAELEGLENRELVGMVRGLKHSFKLKLREESAACSKTNLQFAQDAGFTTVKEYIADRVKSATVNDGLVPHFPLIAASDPRTPLEIAHLDLDVFKIQLRAAYASGTQARAELSGLSWEEYTQSIAGMEPEAYLTSLVNDANLTVSSMPQRFIGQKTESESEKKKKAKMSEAERKDAEKKKQEKNNAERREQRRKWDDLCALLFEAGDYDAKTRIAESKPTTTPPMRSKKGRPITIV